MTTLVLGGGAAWGIAHLGVLDVLMTAGYRFDRVVGTSAGAIVGAMLAADVSLDDMKELVKSIQWSDLGHLTVPRLGFMDSSAIETLLEEAIGKDRQFEDLALPLQVVATDIQRGEQWVLDQGSVARAVRASASIPGVFTPVEHQGRLLVDGGLVNNLPVDVAAESGDGPIIAVQLVYAFPQDRPENLLELGLLCFGVMQKSRMKSEAKAADVLIKPDLSGISAADLSAYETLLERGRAAARDELDSLT